MARSLLTVLMVILMSSCCWAFTCVQDPSDPYEPDARMLFGADQGQCIDTHEERVPVILSETDTDITFANFRHGRRWWIATLPKYGIDRVYFVLAQFKGLQGDLQAAHGQYRVVMRQDQPLILSEQRDGRPYQSTALQEFMISAESFQARGSNPGASGSLHGQIGILTRFVSVAERVTDELIRGGSQKVMQNPLLIDPHQAAHFVRSALDRTIRIGFSDVYNYLRHHCVAVALETLDEAFPPHGPVPDAALTLVDVFRLDTVVGPARNALAARGMIRSNDQFTLDALTDNGYLYLSQMIGAMEDSPERRELMAIRDQRRR